MLGAGKEVIEDYNVQKAYQLFPENTNANKTCYV